MSGALTTTVVTDGGAGPPPASPAPTGGPNAAVISAQERAQQIFVKMDTDGNGILDEKEFVFGCLADSSLVQMLVISGGGTAWTWTKPHSLKSCLALIKTEHRELREATVHSRTGIFKHGTLMDIQLFCVVPPVARLTRFEERGHKKFPKGPPLAYVFWKISKGSPLCLRFLENFQRVPPLLTFFEKIQKKLSKGGVLAFSPPLDLTPLNAPLTATQIQLFCVVLVKFSVCIGLLHSTVAVRRESVQRKCRSCEREGLRCFDWDLPWLDMILYKMDARDQFDENWTCYDELFKEKNLNCELDSNIVQNHIMRVMSDTKFHVSVKLQPLLLHLFYSTQWREKNYSRIRQFSERYSGKSIVRVQKPSMKSSRCPFYQHNHVREGENFHSRTNLNTP